MQIKKGLLLFCILLVLSLGLLIAADRKKTCIPSPAPLKECKLPLNCCQSTTPHPNITPWNFFTEGLLHIAV